MERGRVTETHRGSRYTGRDRERKGSRQIEREKEEEWQKRNRNKGEVRNGSAKGKQEERQ